MYSQKDLEILQKKWNIATNEKLSTIKEIYDPYLVNELEDKILKIYDQYTKNPDLIVYNFTSIEKKYKIQDDTKNNQSQQSSQKLPYMDFVKKLLAESVDTRMAKLYELYLFVYHIEQDYTTYNNDTVYMYKREFYHILTSLLASNWSYYDDMNILAKSISSIASKLDQTVHNEHTQRVYDSLHMHNMLKSMIVLFNNFDYVLDFYLDYTQYEIGNNSLISIKSFESDFYTYLEEAYQQRMHEHQTNIGNANSKDLFLQYLLFPNKERKQMFYLVKDEYEYLKNVLDVLQCYKQEYHFLQHELDRQEIPVLDPSFQTEENRVKKETFIFIESVYTSMLNCEEYRDQALQKKKYTMQKKRLTKEDALKVIFDHHLISLECYPYYDQYIKTGKNSIYRIEGDGIEEKDIERDELDIEEDSSVIVS